MAEKKRSVMKTFTWRVFATIATFFIVFGFTGRVDISIGAGIIDTITKTILYYYHERLWDRIDFGR